MNYLSVENLTKSFGDRVIFSDVSFGIDLGQKVAIVAKNGNGKTTLLRCLMEMEPYDSGRVVYRNDIRVAFMQQSENLDDDHTILEAVFSHDLPELQIVKKLVAKNQLPVTIVGCPIYREANQLAMSSRNERLSADERNQASIIYQTLLQAKVLFQNETIESAIQLVQQKFENHPLFDLEYFVIADEETLSSSNTKEENKKYRAFIAVFVNNIRLIDTISLN